MVGLKKGQTNSGSFKKGNVPKSPFKKGMIPWNKGKRCPQISKELKGRKLSEEHKKKSIKNLIFYEKGIDYEHQFKTNHKPWNKNLKGVMPIPWNKGNRAYTSNCKRCGKEVEDSLPRVYCSKSCWAKDVNTGRKRIDLTGENNHNWNGGISSLNEKLRKSSMFKIWREAVFLRDNFTCQNLNCEYCNNKIGIMLHPHHIKSFAEYPKFRFRIENGVTYCAEFHIKSKILHKNIQKMEVN